MGINTLEINWKIRSICDLMSVMTEAKLNLLTVASCFSLITQRGKLHRCSQNDTETLTFLCQQPVNLVSVSIFPFGFGLYTSLHFQWAIGYISHLQIFPDILHIFHLQTKTSVEVGNLSRPLKNGFSYLKVKSDLCRTILFYSLFIIWGKCFSGILPDPSSQR